MKKGTIAVMATIAGVALGAIAVKLNSKSDDKYKHMSDKHLALMLLYNQWLVTKQQGKSVIDYFHKNNIQSVAIYGMSYVGERLYEELKDSDIVVKYGIDKNADGIYSEIDIVSPDDKLEDVDAVIVTPVFFYSEIEEVLRDRVNAEILSLEDILYDI